MASKRLRREYAHRRAAGIQAWLALRGARTALRWEAAEAAGLVELGAEPDEGYDLRGSFDVPEHVMREVEAQAERDGVWVVLGRYCVDPESDRWEVGDALGGVVGDPVRELEDSGYGDDVRAETLAALACALRGRCAKCHGTGSAS